MTIKRNKIKKVIKVNVYYYVANELNQKIIDIEAIRDEFEEKLQDLLEAVALKG